MALDLRLGPGYTYAAAARRLGCTTSWVSQLVKAGRLQTVSVDNRRYVSGTSLAAYKANVTRKVEDRLTVPMFPAAQGRRVR
jgi:transposase-like protein